jgi:electron transfer flavoprotein beta subunit
LKVLVCIKQTPDPNAIRFDASGNFAGNTPRVVSEYDQYAIEEAILIKERQGDGDVTVMSLGPAGAKDGINRALAMGADRGVLLTSDSAALDTMQVASALAEEARANGYDLILVGQETSDGGSGNVGPQLAALLELPLISNVVGLEIGADGALTLQREVEDGRHVVTVTPPAVVCALTGLNEPRNPSLKGIMAARKKPVEERPVAGIDTGAQVSWGPLRAEQREVAGTIIDGTDADAAAEQVVALLRERKLL